MMKRFLEEKLQPRKQRLTTFTPSRSDQTRETHSDLSLPLRSPPETENTTPFPGGAPSAHSFPDGVKVLHDCPDAMVDVCFVHGLTGDRETTWTADGQATPWPKTLLPPRLGKARILTYGYDVYKVRKSVASSNRLINHATNLLHDLTADRASYQASSRPIIFVAHSLGGLVCKEAILVSRNNPEAHLRGIFDCTKGVIFMGTPHKGAWMAEWARIPASALGLVRSVNKPLLKILETDDQLLESIQVRFWSMVRELREGGRGLDVTCFYEELPLPVVGCAVSKDSATLEGYNSASIHANHRDMVRFGSAEDNGFKRLLGELVRWKCQISNDSVAMSSTSQTDMDGEFCRVVDAFKVKAELTPEELQFFQSGTLDQVLATLGSIQKEQSNTKRLVYMKRIEPFLKTMDEYGKVIQIFVNTSEILAFVWGPLRYLLMITSTVPNVFNSLLETYQQIGEQIPLLVSYQSLFSEHAHMRSLLVMIYKDITSFHVMALRYFRQRLWRQLFQSNWNGFTSDISLLKDNLRRHKQLIEGRASLIEFETVQNLRASAEARFRELKGTETRRRRTAVFQWLSSQNLETAHERHVKARSWDPQSCRWILQDHRFQQWFDPLYCSTPLLWINGKPGSGKSVLASAIIEEARMLKDVSIAFFYCAHGDPERDRFVPMARAILSQLLAQDESLLLHFEEKMSTSSGQAVLSSSKLAQELLETSLKSRKTYIILDEIDECGREQRKEICCWFRSVVDSLPRTKQDEIRCLFISQDDGIARKDLSMLSTISLTSDHNRADITAFARQWQDRIEERFGPLRDYGLDLTEIVPARSRGMFIFAKCVLEELYRQPSRDALLREWRAECFPTELQEVYDRILRRLMDGQVEQGRKITKKLLSWISLSKRPLRWFEIQAAVSIDLDNETINEDHRRLVDTSKDLCASFVEVHSDQTVEFVHGTVRDFLTTKEIVKPSQVELELCLLSVAYLSFSDICSTSAPQTTEAALLLGRYSFYEYAVACWVPHLMAWLSGEHHDEASVTELQETIGPFLDQHYSDGGQTSTVSKTMHDKLQVLRHFDVYDSLAQAVMWSRKQFLVGKNDSQKANLLDFPDITHHVRSVLEGTARAGLTPERSAALELYYGGNWFKCPRIYCQYFYNGFQSQESRDRHLTRHERAYTCTFDGCPTATFGCISKKDLDRHILESHGISGDGKDFPDVSNPNPETTKKTPAQFSCTICGRLFTRKYNLRAHSRTHTDERPFVCTVCGKSFTRNYDRKSHEDLHSGEKRFVCKGDLKVGGQWGCGRCFSRAAALVRHWGSKSGRICIKPLLDDERLEQSQPAAAAGLTVPASTVGNLSPGCVNLLGSPSTANVGTASLGAVGHDPSMMQLNWDTDVRADRMIGERSPQQSNDNLLTDVYPLPAALLAQYPALAELNWNENSGGWDEYEQLEG